MSWGLGGVPTGAKPASHRPFCRPQRAASKQRRRRRWQMYLYFVRVLVRVTAEAEGEAEENVVDS